MAVDTFDTEIGDIDDLLIWNVRDSTDPPRTAIETWILVGAAELHGLAGDIPTVAPCGGEGFRTRARHVVALYAAAMAEDAHYPERTDDRDAGDYGSRLWARHKAQIEALVRDLEACRDGLDPGLAHGGSEHSFPYPPDFSRTMGG